MFAKTSSSILAGTLLAAVWLSTTAGERLHDQAQQLQAIADTTIVDADGHRYGLAAMSYEERATQGVDDAVGSLKDNDVRIEAPVAEPAPGSTVKLYWPAGPGPYSVVVYYREAGSANSDTEHAGAARALAKSADAVVVSVSLRTAAAGVTDVDFRSGDDREAYGAYQWALANADSLGGDPRRVVVMGEGLAGPVAMAVAARAQQANVPAPYYLVLVNAPTTNVSVQPAAATTASATSSHLWDIALPAAAAESARSTDKNYRAM
ncbi:alpha/beta hydrolase fold domain-containing protein [Nevskia ramosa]|uniref:alpha/beta hydrolase fold domain-containing protein n=1 Tax=Nevskia ramosa TaxID=64002 RepID=UPI0003B3FAA3|nr:alpha/beta hydrolase fold domain-containing protein [Nevskia ramosa]